MTAGTSHRNPEDFTLRALPETTNVLQTGQNLDVSDPKSLKHSGCCPSGSIRSPSDWFYLIRNHVSRGQSRESLLVYSRIRRNGMYVLGFVPLILKACASLSMLHNGKALHAESIKAGVDCDVLVGTSLISLYVKCCGFVDSRKVFDSMPERNAITCNAMLRGYLISGDTKSALVLFEKMSTRTPVTWIEMIDGFAKNGDTVSARCFFDRVPPELKNVVTWTVMVDGYASNGKMEAARVVFEAMPKRNFFVWSSMISGYFKKGNVQKARAIFNRIPVRNLVNWSSLISGYARNGFCEEALEAFRKMQAEGFEPDEVTMTCVLSACAHLGRLDIGKEIHHMIYVKKIKLNQFVFNALVDMYAKCGDLSTARLIFEGMLQRNNVCWNAMISGFAIHGQSKEALEFFGRMEESSEKPDAITFLSVLSACAHGGFVNEGLEIYSKMEKYGLQAGMKHYGCLVDLLGRAGRMREAYELIKRMPMKPNDGVWGALLGACRIHLDMELVKRVVEEVAVPDSNMGSSDDMHYVLLSNIYAASDRWEKAERMRMIMENKGSQKTPGCSSIMLNSTEHQFHASAF